MALMLFAASSGPVRVWITPTSAVNPAAEGIPVDTRADAQTATRDRVTEGPRWVGSLVQVISAALIVVLALVVAAIATMGRVPPWRFRRARELTGRQLSTLPEFDEPSLDIDVAAAFAALEGGTPRNAIVRCWMQLERDAAAAGLSRHAAETPEEYMQRVVASSSVDPGPIADLTALYREARFSTHELDDGHRARAAAALGRVAVALDRGVQVSL